MGLKILSEERVSIIIITIAYISHLFARKKHFILTHFCPPLRSTFAVREKQSLGQQMLNATVGINGLRGGV